MTPMLGRVEAQLGASARRVQPGIRGEEFIFVLDGVLDMHFADGRIARLAKHDSIYFDSGLGHLYVNGGDEPAEILVVCCDEQARAIQDGVAGKRPRSS
jgi:uncharacterized cupin superfamily protein